MHLKRLLTALFLIPLLYLYVTKLPSVYFSALISAAGIFGLWEFLSMYRTEWVLRISGLALGALLLFSAVYDKGLVFDILAVAFITVALIRLLSKNPQSAAVDISPVMIALLYIPGLLVFQMLLRELGHEWIIFLYGVIWSADSLAFYVGSSIGRIKLYPSVSPRKTVEGAAGSLIGGILAAILLDVVLSMPLSIVEAGVLGFILGSSAILGDLIESMFKRDAGVKDSGNIFPGHGGILDKMDGALISAPVLYWSLSFFLR